MPTAFVAVIRAEEIPAGPAADLLTALTGTGARSVHTLRDLDTCGEPEDTVALLLDLPPLAAAGQAEQVAAVLATLGELDDVRASGVVVATVRPVTDTLKQVAPSGALTGTADREHHRLVAAPIATRLGLLRAALAREPEARTAGEILAALAWAGASVVATG